jgi:hypothetical protein
LIELDLLFFIIWFENLPCGVVKSHDVISLHSVLVVVRDNNTQNEQLNDIHAWLFSGLFCLANYLNFNRLGSSSVILSCAQKLELCLSRGERQADGQPTQSTESSSSSRSSSQCCGRQTKAFVAAVVR